MLTTGAKELAAFSGLGYIGCIPGCCLRPKAWAPVKPAGIPHRNVIAMQGPFSTELNVALLRQFGIRYLVTKDGGPQGGFAEKAEAAHKTGTVLVVIRRPADSGETEEEILQFCKGLIP